MGDRCDAVGCRRAAARCDRPFRDHRVVSSSIEWCSRSIVTRRTAVVLSACSQLCSISALMNDSASATTGRWTRICASPCSSPSRRATARRPASRARRASRSFVVPVPGPVPATSRCGSRDRYFRAVTPSTPHATDTLLPSRNRRSSSATPIVTSAWHRHVITGGPVSRPLGAAQLAHVLVRRHARPLQGALLELINFNVLYWTGLDCTIMQCNALSKVRCSSSSTSM